MLTEYRYRSQGGGVLGFLLGIALGACIGWSWEAPDVGWATLSCAVVLGGLGAGYGDRFWSWIGPRLWFL